jgi:cytochrome c oxidase subunit 2
MARCVLLVGLAVWFCAVPALAQERTTVIKQGEQLFSTHGCNGCHTVGKVGTPIGPDLSHVGAHYALSYLTGWLRDPVAQKRPAHMPKLDLSEHEIQALAAYLSSLR